MASFIRKISVLITLCYHYNKPPYWKITIVFVNKSIFSNIFLLAPSKKRQTLWLSHIKTVSSGKIGLCTSKAGRRRNVSWQAEPSLMLGHRWGQLVVAFLELMINCSRCNYIINVTLASLFVSHSERFKNARRKYMTNTSLNHAHLDQLIVTCWPASC